MVKININLYVTHIGEKLYLEKGLVYTEQGPFLLKIIPAECLKQCYCTGRVATPKIFQNINSCINYYTCKISAYSIYNDTDRNLIYTLKAKAIMNELLTVKALSYKQLLYLKNNKTFS